jgi:hypothetical protein
MKKELSVKLVKGLFAFGAVSATLLASSAGFAQQNLSSSVTTVQNGLTNIPSIIAGTCYIGGAAILGTGLMKLKAHSENPGQTPLGHGLGRVCMGGALLAAPAIGTWVQNSMGTTGNGTTYKSFGTIN